MDLSRTPKTLLKNPPGFAGEIVSSNLNESAKSVSRKPSRNYSVELTSQPKPAIGKFAFLRELDLGAVFQRH